MHKPFVTTAQSTLTHQRDCESDSVGRGGGGGGWDIVQGSSSQCRARVVAQIYPQRNLLYGKIGAMTVNRSPHGRAFSRAVMDKNFLLFVVSS